MRRTLYKGIFFMLLSSLFACTGQFCWKIFTNEYLIVFFISGILLYGVGLLLMLYGLRFGEFSILHPMQGAGYVWSTLLGVLVLHESVSISRIVGIAIILVGLILLSLPERGTSE